MIPVLKARTLDFEAGGARVATINKDFADDYDIHSMDRIKVSINNESMIVLVNITQFQVTYDQIGFFREVWDELKVRNNDEVMIESIAKPKALDAIKKKLDGEELTKDEIYDIIKGAVDNTLTSVELATFVSAIYAVGMTISETANLTKAMVSFGDKLHFGKKTVVDKHCVGGVAGNRTTLLVVPIVAAAGLIIPKLSSRAISSPSGTADTMEVLAPVSIPSKELKTIVKKVGACIAWGGALKIASADDELIRIRHPMKLDPEALLLSSIMAKKKAAGSKIVLVDVPFGEGSKIESIGEAKHLARQFELIGEALSMRVDVILTDGSQPIGNGIGPSLEARDVLKILTNKDGPKDLREKALMMAGKLLELGKKAQKGRGLALAEKILESGKAYSKFKEIIKAQGGNPNIAPEEIRIGSFTHDVKTSRAGVVAGIDSKKISSITRAAGAPKDKEAGIYLRKHVNDKVKRGDVLFTIHAGVEHKLERAIKAYNEESGVISIA